MPYHNTTTVVVQDVQNGRTIGWLPKGGYFHIRRSGRGGLGPGIEFRGKIWGKVQSSSPNKRINLGSSVTTRPKNWERITILGNLGLYLKFKGQNLGYLSPIFFGEQFGARI